VFEMFIFSRYNTGKGDLPFITYLQQTFGLSPAMACDIAFGIAHCCTGSGEFSDLFPQGYA
jgi:hypothetical protein